MSEHSSNANESPSTTHPVRLWPRLLAGLAGLAVFVLAWFAIAGRATWVQAWAFLAVFTVYSAALGLWLARADPGLFQERNRPAENAENSDSQSCRKLDLE